MSDNFSEELAENERTWEKRCAMLVRLDNEVSERVGRDISVKLLDDCIETWRDNCEALDGFCSEKMRQDVEFIWECDDVGFEALVAHASENVLARLEFLNAE